MVGAYDVIECPLTSTCPHKRVGEICVGLRVLNCKHFARFLDQLFKWLLVNVNTLETTHFTVRVEGKRIVVEVKGR